MSDFWSRSRAHLHVLLWIASIGVMGTSILRARNVGWNSELYLISCAFYAPICADAFASEDYKVAIRNAVYMVVAFVGYLSWRM